MNIDNLKISVIIITYNQENLIGRALNSVLCQKEFVFEIIVSDDCSKDNTWQVIQEYKKQYPLVIKPFRKKVNLGIFKNLESTWDKTAGDLIIYLAGDDIICNGLFQKATNFFYENKIDFSKGSFCLYSDSKMILPNGDEILRSNQLISKGYNAISLKIRGLIGSSRGILYSKELFHRFKTVKKNIGIYTDGLYDIQVQLYSDKNYYLNFIGGIYYAGIGIANKTTTKKALKSLISLYNEFYSTIDFTKKDKFYLLFKKESLLFFIEPSINKFIRTWKYGMKSINIHFGINVFANIKLFLKMLIIIIKSIRN